MVRSLARCVVVFSISFTLFASALRAQDWQFGVHVDPAISWFFSDTHYVTNAGAQVGLRSGVEVTWSALERVGVLFGASYDLRGGNLLYADTSLLVDTRYEGKKLLTKGSVMKTKAQYIYIPLGVKMRAIQIGYWTISAAAGLSCDILFSQRVECNAANLKVQAAKDFFSWGFPGYFFRVGAEYSLGGRSAVDMGIAYHGAFSAVAKPGIGKLYYHNLAFRIGFLF